MPGGIVLPSGPHLVHRFRHKHDPSELVPDFDSLKHLQACHRQREDHRMLLGVDDHWSATVSQC